jgi:hypothetical protein
VTDRKKMEGYFSTGQCPQWAVVPVEEEDIYIYIYIQMYIHTCIHTYIHKYIHTVILTNRCTHSSLDSL